MDRTLINGINIDLASAGKVKSECAQRNIVMGNSRIGDLRTLIFDDEIKACDKFMVDGKKVSALSKVALKRTLEDLGGDAQDLDKNAMKIAICRLAKEAEEDEEGDEEEDDEDEDEEEEVQEAAAAQGRRGRAPARAPQVLQVKRVRARSPSRTRTGGFKEAESDGGFHVRRPREDTEQAVRVRFAPLPRAGRLSPGGETFVFKGCVCEHSAAALPIASSRLTHRKELFRA